MSREPFYIFLKDGVSFSSSQAPKHRTVYAPLCGRDATSLKSSITPFLSGDIKIDKFSYVTKPASTEDLRYDLRNFFIEIEGQGIFSLNKETSPDSAHIEAGQLWHKLIRDHKLLGIQISALNFVPVNGDNIEIMQVSVENTSTKPVTFTPTGCVPLFCRALANKHDHEHVTSLLNRIEQVPQGVVVTPSMSFDEEGHNVNEHVYFVLGLDGKGALPEGSFPTTESFYGEGGNLSAPQAILKHSKPASLKAEELAGKEAVGALRFAPVELAAGEKADYIFLIGVVKNRDDVEKVFNRYQTAQQVDAALEEVKVFWSEKSSAVTLKSGDQQFNSWMRWVTIQPVLRRIYGCSFLPDHDYGKGGKGWRDIWQDLLSLILIEPLEVKETLIQNFAGVRIDGSNATIIGERPGEFIGDRNAITRVWMDHGVWPFSTILLYIHQTGDFDILLNDVAYFKDLQLSRTFKKDEHSEYHRENMLLTENGETYRGSILEHILIQQLVQFFNVGEHNMIRLESADWNDGLDMAFDRGESVAFSSFYAGNLIKLAELLEKLQEVSEVKELSLAKEVLILLDGVNQKKCDYEDPQAKRRVLFEEYCSAVEPKVSGEKVNIAITEITKDLREKGQWIFDHIRKNEKINVEGRSWFNGYYDNQGQRVEGEHDGHVRMTLTGQVFPVMSGLADDQEIKQVVESVRTYLKDDELGGFRLNSNFHVDHYLDLGRAFGFAFGTKENGAVFSHMAVMYAYALYSRGFAREGYEVLHSIYQMSTDSRRAKIYPGVPEYFDAAGRGMYHFLTGSASWFVLTALTQQFGLRGFYGDLLIEPKLVCEEFDEDGKAGVSGYFAGKHISVTYENPQGQDWGHYTIESAYLNEKKISLSEEGAMRFVVPREDIESSLKNKIHIRVCLV